MAKEELFIEVEAVQAVYGDDCLVLEKYPPHLHICVQPRTADVSSQQFVEAVIGIRAGPKYPQEPPYIDIIESKGLDEQRHKHLITSIRDKASELSSCLMLVALCEEAVERLSNMNHPDGNCPLCLYSLADEPFMKLMSCFHCFHCDCITGWWNWLQSQKEANPTSSSVAIVHPSRVKRNKQGISGTTGKSTGNCIGISGTTGKSTGNCPVCRKVFHAKDIEHVLDLVETCSESGANEVKANEEELLHSDSENIRRLKFETILKLQQENSGLIEPKRNEVLLPGMYLPRATAIFEKEETEHHSDPAVDPGINLSDLSHRASTSRRNPGMRKQRPKNSGKHVRQWIKKDTDN